MSGSIYRCIQVNKEDLASIKASIKSGHAYDILDPKIPHVAIKSSKGWIIFKVNPEFNEKV